VDREILEQELTRAGWEVDGSFSGHIAIGNAGNLCILIPERSWQGIDPVYDLYDVEKNTACWVRMIRTPLRAAMLLEQHGETPENGVNTS
jgi:hypothetical protein